MFSHSDDVLYRLCFIGVESHHNSQFLNTTVITLRCPSEFPLDLIKLRPSYFLPVLIQPRLVLTLPHIKYINQYTYI